MGLFDFFWRLFGLGAHRSPPAGTTGPDASRAASSEREFARPENDPPMGGIGAIEQSSSPAPPKASAASPHPRKRLIIEPLEYQSSLIPTRPDQEMVRGRPYRFASIGPRTGIYLDLSQDCDQRWLEYYNLPLLRTPDELADWLGISIGKLAWLTHRTTENQRPETVQKSHYAYRWLEKRSGGWRLIEAPKLEMKLAQQHVLREILNHVPAHGAAHGFVGGRSIVTNAAPHVGRRFLLKLDLKDFYTNVRYSRVVAIFRSLGYSREVAIWLARLTTTAIPWNLKAPVTSAELAKFSSRHLPQGGVTSPALANLSAFSLDVRLSGLAAAYSLNYTRYADDLTFSGPGKAVPALHEIVQLVRKIIRSERFHINQKKFRVIRNSQRQSVTGVIVNERLNVSRDEFDRLKAILHHCAKLGPASQNREGHPHFQDHLRGRIAHVLQLSQTRGEKLLALYQRIDWTQ